jgi:small subunit ribosomal protein S17
MAEETPENLVEEVEQAAQGDDVAGAPAAPEAPTSAPAAGATRRERLEARRLARRPPARGPVTPEQREAERRERRAEVAKQRRAYRAKLKTRRAATRAEQPASGTPAAAERSAGKPKVRQGVVTSAKGEKTITVKIDVVRRHRRYHKILRSTIKLHAHDEANTAAEGDTVRVVECRPMSASKRWRLVEIVERAR